jgi:protein-tyrosine phosphatase
VAKVHGIDISGLRARCISKEDFKRFDLLVAMDAENEHYLKNHSGKESGRICLLREYDPKRNSTDVPDPYYQGNFEEVYEIIERSCRVLLEEVARSISR